MKRYVIQVCALLTVVGMAVHAERGHPAPHATGKAVKTAEMQPKQGYYGTMRFYEGYNGSQDTFCATDITQLGVVMTLKMSSCDKNDEAKSMRFETGVPSATIVRVYDNPNCDTGDDWAEIRTRRVPTATAPITVWNFEDNDSDDPQGYTITYHREDGNLDGKVSCVKFIIPSAP